MPKLLIPKETHQDLIALINTDLGQIEKIINILNSPKATSLRTQEVLSQIADVLNRPLEDAYDIAMLIDFISRQKKLSKASEDEFISDIQAAITERGGKDTIENLMSPPCREALLRLFGARPIAELAKKKEKLETGLLKTLTKIEGTCELRPVFNLERTHIVDKVVTVIARLTLEDDMENKKHLIFQLNNESLKELKEFLEVTERKMKIMEEITAVEPEK